MMNSCNCFTKCFSSRILLYKYIELRSIPNRVQKSGIVPLVMEEKVRISRLGSGQQSGRRPVTRLRTPHWPLFPFPRYKMTSFPSSFSSFLAKCDWQWSDCIEIFLATPGRSHRLESVLVSTWGMRIGDYDLSSDGKQTLEETWREEQH